MAVSPASVDLKDILVAASVGVFAASTGWSIAISKEPTTPNTAITLYDAGNWAEANAKWLMDSLVVQVRVRGDVNGYLGAMTKAQEVKDTLLGLTPQVVNTNDYRGIWQQTDILSLGYDDNNRPQLVQNFRIIREPSTATNRIPL